MKREAHSFYFKQFAVRHDRSSMKVGTDGVLLGAWASVSGAHRILDIGTGTGVIALMLAQRSGDDTKIDAVEISPRDAEAAAGNVQRSPWRNRIFVHAGAIQELNSDARYDLIVSNPPYFNNSTLPPEADRGRARHTGSLDFSELLEHALRLLAPAGRFSLILPVSEGEKFKQIAHAGGMNLARETEFHSRSEKPAERLLLEFSRTNQPLVRTKLVLYDKGEAWSAEYCELMGAFYLDI